MIAMAYCPLCGSEKSLYEDIERFDEFFCKNCNARWKWKSGWGENWCTLINPSNTREGIEYLNQKHSISFWSEYILELTRKKKFQEKKNLDKSHMKEIKVLLKNYVKLDKIKNKIQSFKNEGYDVEELEKMMESLENQEINGTNVKEKAKKTAPTFKDFEKSLEDIWLNAQQQGKIFIDVKSGDLHRIVGGYPGYNHRMPICCNVMKKKMKYTDQILKEPPKGFGANLIIRFKLPR